MRKCENEPELFELLAWIYDYVERKMELAHGKFHKLNHDFWCSGVSQFMVKSTKLKTNQLSSIKTAVAGNSDNSKSKPLKTPLHSSTKNVFIPCAYPSNG